MSLNAASAIAHFIYGLLISWELCANVYQQPRSGSEAKLVWKEIVG